LFFDGSRRKEGSSAGVVLLSPKREQLWYMVHPNFQATNNMIEHEVLFFGLTTSLGFGSRELLTKGDSQLVIKQVQGECYLNDPQLAPYLIYLRKLESTFDFLELCHILLAGNYIVDELSMRVSIWEPVPKGVFE
jgi:ribonuclease HI